MVQFLKCEITCSIIQRILLTWLLYSFCQSRVRRLPVSCRAWSCCSRSIPCRRSSSSGPSSAVRRILPGAADGRLGDPERFANFCLGAVVPHVGKRSHYRSEEPEAW